MISQATQASRRLFDYYLERGKLDQAREVANDVAEHDVETAEDWLHTVNIITNIYCQRG